MSNSCILFYVQSCRGVGHVHRIAAIATSLSSTHPSAKVIIASGGPEIPDLLLRLKKYKSITFIQLETLQAAQSETWKLVDIHQKPITTELEARRRNALLGLLRSEKPTTVVIEMFPFGRRRFHFEIEPLLDACYEQPKRPLIICSVRDLLVQQKSIDQKWSLNKINTYFDHVFVHGDPNIIPFGRTFIYAKELSSKIIYTGYVIDNERQYTYQQSNPISSTSTKSTKSTKSTSTNEIFVSTGGSGSGNIELFYKSIMLARLRLSAIAHKQGDVKMRNITWRVRINQCRWDELLEWRKQFDERYVDEINNASYMSDVNFPTILWECNQDSDFLEKLSTCTLAIVQGGYNTTMETILTNTKTIMIPISTGARGKDTEQLQRATAFHALGLIDVIVPENNLLDDNKVQLFINDIQRLIKTGTSTTSTPTSISTSTSTPTSTPAMSSFVKNIGSTSISTRIHLNGASQTATVLMKLQQEHNAQSVALQIPLPISVASIGFSPPTLASSSTSSTSSSSTSSTSSSSTSSTSSTSSNTSIIPTTTVLLLNYKRPENVRRILTDLSQQKPVPPDIFLWNNSGMIFTDSRITWQIDSSMNKYCWPRWMMASLARTKYICTMDDDFTLSDDYVLSDMVQHADIEADASQIIGFTGTIFHPNFNESYQNGFHVNANKFNWNNSIELKWQKGIVYQTVSNIQEKYRANSILNSNHALLKSKPWHSTPKWIWEKEEKKEKEKEEGRATTCSTGGWISPSFAWSRLDCSCVFCHINIYDQWTASEKDLLLPPVVQRTAICCFRYLLLLLHYYHHVNVITCASHFEAPAQSQEWWQWQEW